MENNTAALKDELQSSAEPMVEKDIEKDIEKEENRNQPNDYSNLKLQDIVDLLKTLVEQEDHSELYDKAEGLKSAFYKTLHREKLQMGKEKADGEDKAEGEEPVGESNPFADIEREFKALFTRYKSSLAETRRQQEAEREANYSKKQQIIDQLKELIEKTEDINKTIPEFRELQNSWKQIGSVPQDKAKDLWETYQHYTEKFYDYIKINNEFRDLDFKKNLEAKTALCEKAEKLDKESNVLTAFREINKLHEEWKEIGPVAKEYRESIWARFKEASTAINKKHQQYFEMQKEAERVNLAAKTTLCEKAEEIAATPINSAGELNALSKRMEELHAEWKKIGYASKKENQKIFDRFSTASKAFFTAKKSFYAELKSTMAENVKRKYELCEKAEALMNSSEWKKASEALILLQKNWKESGPAPRKSSDALWNRFRTACDCFFERKSKHFEEENKKQEENLRLKKEILAEIKEFEVTGDRDENIAAMRSFQNRWKAVGFVPNNEREKVQREYNGLMDEKFRDIRSVESDKKMKRFKRSVSDMKGSSKGETSLRYERDRLLQKYRKIEQDIATLENNMGFFTKSKNAETYIKDIERKIEIAKKELDTIEDKIKIIDQQFE